MLFHYADMRDMTFNISQQAASLLRVWFLCYLCLPYVLWGACIPALTNCLTTSPCGTITTDLNCGPTALFTLADALLRLLLPAATVIAAKTFQERES